MQRKKKICFYPGKKSINKNRLIFPPNAGLTNKSAIKVVSRENKEPTQSAFPEAQGQQH